MITPEGAKSSQLVDGFGPVRVARTPLADPEAYRGTVAPEEWAAAQRLDGRRRIEHVAGRAAAHAALAAFAPGTVVAITRAADGAPELRGCQAALSISHGRRDAVAAVGRARALGIDLCDLDDAPRVRRIAPRFLDPGEAALAHDAADWAALWAIKEAAAKALRRGLLDGGLRASRVIALDPPRLAFPALTAIVVRGERDAIAVVYG